MSTQPPAPTPDDCEDLAHQVADLSIRVARVRSQVRPRQCDPEGSQQVAGIRF